MNYTGSAVSAVETCAKPPTDEFIDAAEKALDAGGLLRSAIKYLRLERYSVYFQGFVLQRRGRRRVRRGRHLP
ncbi:hypothetical protein ACWEWX_04195, partial [Streptomyces asiaticus]